MECGMKLIKWLLFVFNLIFFLCGLGLIITGAVVQLKFKEYLDFFDNNISASAIVLIVVGVIIFFIGFFGCFGAVRESHCMVMTFAAILCIVFIMEIGTGIAAYVFRNEVEDVTRDGMEKSLKNYGASGHDGVTKSWDALQKQFDCCGVQNYTDWENEKIPYPESCCKDKSLGAACVNSTTNLYPDGCLDGFENFVVDKIAQVGAVGVAFAFIQVVGIVFACCLARAIKNEYEVV